MKGPRDVGEMVLVSLCFPMLWVLTHLFDLLDAEEEPVRFGELRDYHKRFWRGEQ